MVRIGLGYFLFNLIQFRNVEGVVKMKILKIKDKEYELINFSEVSLPTPYGSSIDELNLVFYSSGTYENISGMFGVSTEIIIQKKNEEGIVESTITYQDYSKLKKITSTMVDSKMYYTVVLLKEATEINDLKNQLELMSKAINTIIMS